jgi:predicted O-methyltransferase YrrM
MSFQFRTKLTALCHRPVVHLVLWRFGIARAETQTTSAERDCLARLAQNKKCLAEVGVYHGVTTCRLLRAMDPNGTLIAIDPYPKQRLGFSCERVIAHAEVSKLNTGDVQWMRTTGADAAKEMSLRGLRNFDFVFIDGDHSWEGLRGDWEGWSELIAPAGIIALHDTRSTHARFIDDYGSSCFTREVVLHDPRFHVIETVDSLTVLQRDCQTV